MRISLGIVILLFSFSAFAKYDKKTNLMDYHKINSRVAQSLNLKKPSNYKRISKNLSVTDKASFKKLYLKNKAKKVKFLPFMSFLYVVEGQKVTAIELIQDKPTKIRVNGGKVILVDSKNVKKSMQPKKQIKKSKKSASLMNFFFPKAHAWGLGWLTGSDDDGSTEEDWALLYGYAISSELYGLAGETSQPGIIAREISNFVNEFGVKEVNCTPDGTRPGDEYGRAIEILRNDGGRTRLDCDSFREDCWTDPFTADGKFFNTLSEIGDLDHQIALHVGNLLEPERWTPSFMNPNHFDVVCGNEHCYLGPDEYDRGTSGPRLLNRLKEIDITTLGDRSQRRWTQEHLEKLQELQRLQEMHYPKGSRDHAPNKGKAMFALAACCTQQECVNYVNDQGKVRMNNGSSTQSTQ